jgi:hypothetical protein
MGDAAWTAIAALGASVLTGGFSVGLLRYQEARREKAAEEDALGAAVLHLLTRSLGLALRARSTGEVAKQRSGLGEGLDVVMHVRKPVDAFQFFDWMAQDWDPLNEAWTDLWLRAPDQRTVELANDLVDRCGSVVGAATAREPAPTTSVERIRRFAAGEKWTPEMLAAHDQALRDLAVARKNLAEHVRKLGGRPAVALFSPSSRADSDDRLGSAVADAWAPHKPDLAEPSSRAPGRAGGPQPRTGRILDKASATGLVEDEDRG